MLVENVAKNAPAGSETAVAVMKSAITAANTTYETIHKASKLSKSPKATSTQPLRPPRRLHRKLRLKLRAPPRRLSKRIHSTTPATPVWPRDGQAA
ncbi:MAG: Granule-associated protein [uncultured Caballeronia sp.]|nr:MAG: Granule-associated protein [uncultured Caballeronia sp.]